MKTKIQTQEDKQVNVSWGNEELKKRIGWMLLCTAEYAEFSLYESDVKWIEKNIATHPLFRTINNTIEYGPNVYEYMVLFFERFLGVPGIPPRVSKLLAYEVGHDREMNRRQHNNNVPSTQRFFCELWLQRQQAWR